ncbi:hypothetical protein BBJ28_00023782 [Nothophytophthora sp. Chile5]|nr:hypothetical protein BBJ28_00023782 [Nothophytophthora sp. Chile5]
MLEVIGAGVGSNIGDATDFVTLFKASDHFQRLQSNLDQEGVTRPSSLLPPLEFGRKRAASNLTQAKFLTKRFFNLYWRTPSYNLTRFIVAAILGLTFGITFVGAEYFSYQGINSGLGMIYLTDSHISFITFNGVLPIASQERASFYRERAAQTYNAFWYFAGSTLVEIPYCFLTSMIFLLFFYPLVGFTGASEFFAYWLNLSLLLLLMAYFGQFLAYSLTSFDVAAVFVVLIGSICMLFTGFNPPAGSIPHGYKWLYHLTPHKYTFASLTAIVFGDCPSDGDGSERGCQQMAGTPPSLSEGITVKEYLEGSFRIKHSEIWMNCGIVVAWIVFIRILALLSLRFINHQKR